MRRWLLLSWFLALAGCDSLPFGFTDIDDVRRRPGFYEGREVKVRGEVVDVVGIPFFEARFYTLRDGTGEIAVFAADRLPDVGERVAVKGVVQSAAIIGGEAFGVRLGEIERLPGYLAR